MKKILDCAASRGPGEHCQVPACIVWCFDPGFRKTLEEFIAAENLNVPDLVTIGGGAKAFASGSAAEKDFVLNQIKTSLRLHRPKRVVLMLHSDCGAYGGLTAFDNDRERERVHHEKELRAAHKFLKDNLPVSLEIKLVFADFDGVYEL